MHFFKSLGDGIGTAAGVAWPMFGLVFGALGLTTVGITSIILASIACSIFLFIAFSVSIWSYKNHIDENNKLNKRIALLKAQILLAINNLKPEDRQKLFPSMHAPDNALITKEIFESWSQKIIKPQSLSVYAKLGITGFCAGFGSIAGCSAGMLGLLSAMGVFPGLNVLPMVGVGVLIAAFLFGLLIAAASVHASHQKNKLEQEKDCYTAIHLVLKPAEIQDMQTTLSANAVKTVEQRKKEASTGFFFAPTSKSQEELVEQVEIEMLPRNSI